MTQIAWSICSVDEESTHRRNFLIHIDDTDTTPAFTPEEPGDEPKMIVVGVEADFALNKLLSDVRTNQVEFLVSHNVEFDLKVLKAESERCGIDITSVLKLPSRCTMKISTPLLALKNSSFDERISEYKENHDMRKRRSKRGLLALENALNQSPKYPSLRELHLHLFKESNLEWHDAVADVEACERCFRTLGKHEVEAWARAEQFRILNEDNRKLEEAERLKRHAQTAEQAAIDLSKAIRRQKVLKTSLCTIAGAIVGGVFGYFDGNILSGCFAFGVLGLWIGAHWAKLW